MQALFSRRAFALWIALSAGLLSACVTHGDAAAGSGDSWQGKAVYSRVGMKVEPTKRANDFHAYSTNYIGLARHFPAGTHFTANKIGRSAIELAADDGSLVHVDFVAKHHKDLNFQQWLERQFSQSQVDLPGNLDDKERAAVQEGRYEVGMSRAALFLAVGYPPSTLSPSLTDPNLKYEVKRFNNIVFSFDDQDRISGIKN